MKLKSKEIKDLNIKPDTWNLIEDQFDRSQLLLENQHNEKVDGDLRTDCGFILFTTPNPTEEGFYNMLIDFRFRLTKLEEASQFQEVPFIDCRPQCCASGVMFRNCSPVPICSRVIPTFSSRRFSVAGFMERSLIHLQLSFVHIINVFVLSNYDICMMVSQFHFDLHFPDD
ncbi:vomeronasal type-2 receptor [Cricetulus griseus]|uniref:Vomeronasal type-2 receptor n=1 Tax=Cricetulus griseus TaxID=10029 RepID=A0A061HZY6_CRIGR|nr:vomeronasal type-2 receptor [Cricetulus griseus]